MKKVALVLVLLGAALSFGASASAAPLLDGQTVRVAFYFPDLFTLFGTPVDAVVGPGVEVTGFPDISPGSNVDLSDTQVRIVLTRTAVAQPAPFNGWVFTDQLGLIAPFTSVSLNPSSTLAGVLVTFDADNIRVNASGLPYSTGQFVLLDINSPQVVPEPASLALLGLALASAGRRRLSRRRG
jgi:hypothetical protein